MTIACLIRHKPGAFHMVSTVHKKYPVAAVVLERPELREGWYGAGQKIVERLRGRRLPLDPSIPVLHTRSVNDEAVRIHLAKLAPTVLLDHGTSIVKAPILAQAPTTLNIHWGLSPYYRGTHCTQWALINNDPYNIGVTVHALAPQVDGGGIFGQRRIIPQAQDRVKDLNAKLSHAGTDIVLQALDALAQGKDLTLYPQDLSQGLLTRARDFTSDRAQEVAAIEKGGLAHMLAHPSREALPIVEA